MNIYLGNLSYEATEEDIKEAFEAFGEVASARIIRDKYTNRSKGFGFVEMPDDGNAQSAIDNLNDTELKGRKIAVNKARPRTDSGRGGGGGYGAGRKGGRQGRGPRF
jgi:RNA recognition motif-containing protein